LKNINKYCFISSLDCRIHQYDDEHYKDFLDMHSLAPHPVLLRILLVAGRRRKSPFGIGTFGVRWQPPGGQITMKQIIAPLFAVVAMIGFGVMRWTKG
jgi:hypothetical protein